MKTRLPDTSTAASDTNGVVRLHYFRLAARAFIFILVLAIYILDSQLLTQSIYNGGNAVSYLLLGIWALFAAELVFRFLPSKHESMGCQKQFQANYSPNGFGSSINNDLRKKQLKDVIYVGSVWFVLNACIGVLFFTGVIDAGALILIVLFYAVSDIICILFYCPFQSLIMKNRCCVSCRIYNWDFLMMFTPLVFIKSFFAISLFIASILLFIRWEAAYYRHPERFYVGANQNLDCNVCSEKICVHKKGA